ncbi:hypothetical protein ACJJTC_019517 [Scirpophaga incertulas]
MGMKSYLAARPLPPRPVCHHNAHTSCDALVRKDGRAQKAPRKNINIVICIVNSSNGWLPLPADGPPAPNIDRSALISQRVQTIRSDGSRLAATRRSAEGCDVSLSVGGCARARGLAEASGASKVRPRTQAARGGAAPRSTNPPRIHPTNPHRVHHRVLTSRGIR